MTALPPPEQITGVILAGGKAERMAGKDKGLLLWAGRPLITSTMTVLRPLCAKLLINANRSLEAYRRFGLPVITDGQPGFQGPLGGILSALRAAETTYLIVAPCDSPHLKSSTFKRLLHALVNTPAHIAIASDGKRLHPVVMAVRTHLADDLAAWLASGQRKIDRWAEGHLWVAVDCSDDPSQFLNINTPEELQAHDPDDQRRS